MGGTRRIHPQEEYIWGRGGRVQSIPGREHSQGKGPDMVFGTISSPHINSGDYYPHSIIVANRYCFKHFTNHNSFDSHNTPMR